MREAPYTPEFSALPCGCDLGAMHICERHLAEGRVIWYNERRPIERNFIDRELVKHPLDVLAARVHAANRKWWVSLETGEPIQRNVGEMLALIHSEISEALEGHRKNLQDDKLPHRKMFSVELVDTVIRILDVAGAMEPNFGEIFEEKMNYNATRHDHTREGRLAEGGKKY